MSTCSSALTRPRRITKPTAYGARKISALERAINMVEGEDGDILGKKVDIGEDISAKTIN